ncbi:MAG: hypothetical protein IT368_18200 [Candidatus Hydrogenedentes bacterium]|nr:hypothetical protein [Candidatus Hydrogenedentota bacterium]
MARRRRISILLFCLKFIVFVSVLVFCWWKWLLPHYGWVLMQLSGGILVNVFGEPIVSGKIVPRGLLNTETILDFVMNIGGRNADRGFPITLLVTNVPPFVALVLATSGLTLWRRTWMLLIGLLVLMVGHILYIVLALHFMQSVIANPQIPTAIAQFFLTLPFLLWIVLAWDRIAGSWTTEAPPASEPPAKS